MSVLNVTNLRKILGAHEILRDASLRIERGEKVGCVGRNGVGKTTLLRLIEGEDHPDGGTVQLTKGARIGYVTQRPTFPPGKIVRAYVEGGLAEVHAVEAELEHVSTQMAEQAPPDSAALDSLINRHGELTARMDFLDGWDSERRVDTVLSGIGLSRPLWEREAATLSGGEKSRTAMARELVSVPDLLLLDEPTNHLDLAGIEWLEEYLENIGSAVFIVSHDRRLLDRVVDTIVEVERGLLNRYPGNYSRYVALKEERYTGDRRAWEQQQDVIRREEGFIKKHMGSQRTAEAKGRRKKLQNLVRFERPFNDVRRPTIRLPHLERGGEQVLDTDGLAVGYEGNSILKNVRLRIGRGERIGVVGPNGGGKTTLLKVLAGHMPQLAGEIRLGHKATCGFYDQETADLREDGTPYTEIRRDHPRMTDLEIRSHLARFLFRGKAIDLAVSSLSGGERARLALARLVLSGASWLALDEPTNHLDLPSRTALEEMLSEWPGAMICVSHDRTFLDSLVGTIFDVRDGGVRAYRGNYTEYREAIAAEQEQGKAKAKTKTKTTPAKQSKPKPKPKPKKQATTEAKARQTKPGKKPKRPKNPWRLEKIEKAIIALEGERDKIMASLTREEVYKNPDSMKEAQFRLAEVERDLDKKNQEWESFA